MSIHKTIKMSLNVASIDRAIEQVNAVKTKTNQARQEVIKALVTRGTEIAKQEVAMEGAVYTGDLMNSIRGEYFNDQGRGVIYSDVPYAPYVEFGTGPMGDQSPHPDAKTIGINYRSTGWRYYNDRDQKYHWTTGKEARPFMYNTLRQLEDMAPQIAEEVMKNSMK